jgi:hypothetical protein
VRGGWDSRDYEYKRQQMGYKEKVRLSNINPVCSWQKKKVLLSSLFFFIFLFQLGVHIPKDLLKALGERPQPFLVSFLSLDRFFLLSKILFGELLVVPSNTISYVRQINKRKRIN